MPPLRSSSNRVSRCCASSSRSDSSAAGASFKAASLSRTIPFQSAIFHPRDSVDYSHKIPPALLFRTEHLTALRSELVIAAPALVGLFDPTALNPSLLLQPVKQRIK